MKVFPFLIFLGCVLSAGSAHAFPEMTTHGYTNCTACHISPSGGGTLTEYGRGLSKELLSATAREGEEKFLYGLMQPPEWLQLGGDVRAIQTYVNTARARRGDFFLMQADVSAAAQAGKWTVAGTLGIRGGPEGATDKGKATSRNHYLMYQPSEGYSFRAGRFLPQFGINEANHTVVTRQGLGFNEDRESYNLEAAYLGSSGDFFLTGILGRPDDKTLNREKGAALSSSLNLAEKNKIGVSALRAGSSVGSRWLAGLWGIVAVSKKIFILSDMDLQWSKTKGLNSSATSGGVSYQRVGYEPTQGFQLYAAHQLSYLNFSKVTSRFNSFGPGLDYFPRPHIELRMEFQRQRMMVAGANYYDYAWLMLHYYF